MGQRDGFARSDLLRINAMYKCDNQPLGGNSIEGYYPQPGKPPRPNNNNGMNVNQVVGGAISHLGSILSALG